MQVTTVAQLTVLEPVSQAGGAEGLLCLLNTHLFFHPQAPHIRSLHVAAMLAEAHALAESAAGRLGRTPSLLFCGDLNSDINDGMPGGVTELPSLPTLSNATHSTQLLCLANVFEPFGCRASWSGAHARWCHVSVNHQLWLAIPKPSCSVWQGLVRQLYGALV